MNPTYLSAREISARFAVPYTPVLEACQRGELLAQRLGPAFAVLETDAIAWVNDYKSRMDPNGAYALRARVAELEAEVAELRGAA
jgi:hypothetical protein